MDEQLKQLNTVSHIVTKIRKEQSQQQQQQQHKHNLAAVECKLNIISIQHNNNNNTLSLGIGRPISLTLLCELWNNSNLDFSSYVPATVLPLSSQPPFDLSYPSSSSCWYFILTWKIINSNTARKDHTCYETFTCPCTISKNSHWYE